MPVPDERPRVRRVPVVAESVPVPHGRGDEVRVLPPARDEPRLRAQHVDGARLVGVVMKVRAHKE